MLNHGDEILTEESPPSSSSSNDFLSYVCRNWEEATQIAKESGIRVVNLRIGIVLSSSDGMLSKILPIFKLGFGIRIGNGNQYMSWIGLDDLLDDSVCYSSQIYFWSCKCRITQSYYECRFYNGIGKGLVTICQIFYF